jgi:hypothetical protein
MKLVVALAMLMGASAQEAPAAPAAADSTRLDIQFGVSGAGVCDLALEHTDKVRAVVAKAIKHAESGESLSVEDIVHYDVSGCSARARRRKVLSDKTATITVGFTTQASKGRFLTADSFYDAATESLKESVEALTADFGTACDCAVNVDTIKLELSTKEEELAEADEPVRKLSTPPLSETFKSPSPSPTTTYYAGADCPNGCSGHGSCSTNGCICWSNWGNGDNTGGACDVRVCPYEIAWVDTPTAENRAHALRECAGRGICDRETGDCACFPGYEGKGCRRTSCPNACSGHGTCEYLAELRNDLGDDFKWTGSAPTRNQYDFEFPLLWDAHKSRACVCDPKYTGLDCSIRMCPRGDFAHYFALEKTPETQAVVITNVFNPVTDGYTGDNAKLYMDNAYKVDMGIDSNQTETNGEFALTFRSTLNEEYTTFTMNVYNLTEVVVEEALNSLPNKVVEEASVVLYRNLSKYNATNYGLGGQKVHLSNYPGDQNYPYDPAYNYTWYDTDLVMKITFNGGMTKGDQYALECRTAYCDAGCQPKLEHPLDFKPGSSCLVMNDHVEAVGVNWECSGRGECGEDGTCECYEGYTDEYCATKTAII